MSIDVVNGEAYEFPAESPGEFVSFLAEESRPPDTVEKEPWLIAVVDDEIAVFEATRIALEGTSFDGRPFKLLYAGSMAEGRRLLIDYPAVTCVLLDVVMETEHAGLDLAREIREQLGNALIRIILRTGQPGYAPPMDVLEQYDINDYKEKTELTRTRLWMTIACGLRSYQQILALELSRSGLRTVVDACADLMQRRGLDDFARGVVMQIAAHLDVPPDGLLCVRQSISSDKPIIIGAAGKFAYTVERSIDTIEDPAVVQAITSALEERCDVIGVNDVTLFIAGQTWIGAIYLKGRRSVSVLDRELLSIFCQNVSLCFENLRLFETVSDLAYTDRVTKLGTHARMLQTIGERIAEGKKPTVMLADIDGYSSYSAALGRGFGEEVLNAIAHRLLEVHPKKGRVGCLVQDTFCLVLDDESPEEYVEKLQGPVTVNGQDFRVGLTFGCSGEMTSENASPTALIQQAEVALKEAQFKKRGHLVRFTPEIEARQRFQVLLSHELRDAMDGGFLSLDYQPKVNSETSKPVSVEALLRWRHPQRGSISPTVFIPAAEASGLIGELGKWVVRRACEEMGDILRSGLIERISINLSPTQLNQPDCIAELDQLVREGGLEAKYVEWEVTESAVLSGETSLSQLRQARSLGYKIALDDFGTGYSSLSMIRSMPLDVVKIDRAFLADLANDNRASTILASISSICRSTGHETVAEGVETPEDLRAVRLAGINIVQGFLFSRPLAVDACATWLRSWQGREKF